MWERNHLAMDDSKKKKFHNEKNFLEYSRSHLELAKFCYISNAIKDHSLDFAAIMETGKKDLLYKYCTCRLLLSSMDNACLRGSC